MPRSPGICQDTNNTLPVYHPIYCTLCTMNAVTSAKLCCIIHTSPPKSCELNHLLTFFGDDLLLFLTVLCNRPIQDGVLLPSQKRSILFPALKHSLFVNC